MHAALAILLAASAAPIPIVSGPAPLFSALRSHHRAVVVHFWATWCATCTAELPEIQRLTKALANNSSIDLVFVSLDPPDKAGEAASYLAQEGLLAPKNASALLLDAPDPSPIAARLNPKWGGELPATFFLLESGAVAASHLGPTPVDEILGEVRARASQRKP